MWLFSKSYALFELKSSILFVLKNDFFVISIKSRLLIPLNKQKTHQFHHFFIKEQHNLQAVVAQTAKF